MRLATELCHQSQNISAFRFKNTELKFVSFIWSLLISIGHKIVIFQMRALRANVEQK